MLARQVLYHLRHSASHFCVGVIFEIGSEEVFAWAGFQPGSS
jgi:hypothetical protein